MKKSFISISLSILLAICITSSVDAKKIDLSVGVGIAINEVLMEQSIKFVSLSADNKAIDGSTSASKLRAKKSHAVSEQDETKLTVFLGMLAITFIVFFIKILTKE